MIESLGRVTKISGAQMTVEADMPLSRLIRIGAMIKPRSGDQQVIGTIAAVEVETDGHSPRHLFVVDLLGEIVSAPGEGFDISHGRTKKGLGAFVADYEATLRRSA